MPAADPVISVVSLSPSTPNKHSPATNDAVDDKGHHRSRRRQAIAEQPAALPGTIVVGTARGWAEVYDRGQKLGTTPLRIELSSGPHELEVRPFGTAASRRIQVDVVAGQVTKVRLEL